MKDRIDNILRVEGISPSKFADEIGVQRSGISHILSGRNNPSLDLLQKILNRYRNINAEWLLTGRGSMYKDGLTGQTHEPIDLTKQAIMDFSDNQPVDNQSTISNIPSITENNNDILKTNMHEKTISKIIVFYSDNSFEELKS